MAAKNIRSMRIKEPQSSVPESNKAFLILKYAHDSAQSILSAFDLVIKNNPGTKKKHSSHEEQDLLRAMLVMASSGLDAMIKQLIRDALLSLANFDERVNEELLKFTSRKLKGDENELNPKRVREFLARILVAESQSYQIVKEFIDSLTEGSLQSAQEVIKAANALGLTQDDIKLESQKLKPIFDIRNQIIHELDIDFELLEQNRHSRTRSKMISHSNFLLEYGENILESVSLKILNARST